MRFAFPFLLACIAVWGLLAADAAPASAQSAQQAEPTPAFFGPPSMSLSTFRHRCIMYSGSGLGDRIGGCGPGDQADICDAYMNTLEPISPDQRACIVNCDRQKQELAPRYVISGCEDVLRNAWRTCTRFCRINYPY